MPKQKNQIRNEFSVLAASLVIIVWGIVQAQSVLVRLLVALFLAVDWSTAGTVAQRETNSLCFCSACSSRDVMVIILLMIGGLVGTSLVTFLIVCLFISSAYRRKFKH